MLRRLWIHSTVVMNLEFSCSEVSSVLKESSEVVRNLMSSRIEAHSVEISSTVVESTKWMLDWRSGLSNSRG